LKTMPLRRDEKRERRRKKVKNYAVVREPEGNGKNYDKGDKGRLILVGLMPWKTREGQQAENKSQRKKNGGGGNRGNPKINNSSRGNLS